MYELMTARQVEFLHHERFSVASFGVIILLSGPLLLAIDIHEYETESQAHGAQHIPEVPLLFGIPHDQIDDERHGYRQTQSH